MWVEGSTEGALQRCVCRCVSHRMTAASSADMITKKGIGNVTVDGLVEQITPTARGIVMCVGKV